MQQHYDYYAPHSTREYFVLQTLECRVGQDKYSMESYRSDHDDDDEDSEHSPVQ
jgi:hypothetical protein